MKTDSEFWCALALLATFFALQFPSLIKAETESAHRVATAVRIKGAPPQLDGVLDDDIWQTAPLHSGFRQRDPDEGEPASQRTTFQIAYDDEAVYFAVICYDREPDKIVSRLVRRDEYVESDKIQIILDPHYNRQRAFSFTIYPSGSVIDGIVGGSGLDEWNNGVGRCLGSENPHSRKWLGSRMQNPILYVPLLTERQIHVGITSRTGD